MRSFVHSLLQSPDKFHRLLNTRTGEVIAGSVIGAFDSASRRKGLLGRSSMPPGEAIIIAPCNAIHTWFMRFDIDVAFVAKGGRVMKLRHGVRPWRMTAAFGAFAAIEFASGTLAGTHTAKGDVFELVSLT